MRKPFLLVLLFMVLSYAAILPWLSPLPAHAAGKHCVLCGEEIRGTYWRAAERYYCHRCYTTAPRCTICRAPSAQLTTMEGRGVCSACMARAPRCAVCGRVMEAYWSIEGRKYCADCGKAVIGNCALCAKLLEGESWSVRNTLNGDAQGYCKDCFSRSRKCDLCSWKVPLQSAPLEDGRYFCRECLATLVTDTGELGRIYREVLAILEKELTMKLRAAPALRPVDLPDFVAKLKGRHGIDRGDSLGLFTCNKGSILRNGHMEILVESPTIYVLWPLPRDIVWWAVAHESGHAWYEENTRDVRREKRIVEGFAEWVAWKVMTLKGIEKEPAFMATRKDIYGEGLRLILQKEKSAGSAGVVEWVKTL